MVENTLVELFISVTRNGNTRSIRRVFHSCVKTTVVLRLTAIIPLLVYFEQYFAVPL